jgi:NADH-quinone oxidoreductase subunit B
MGACANCGGLFQKRYTEVKSIDKLIPVDMYLPGCAPRPEALNEALLNIQKKIEKERWVVRMKMDSEKIAR